MLSRRTPMKRTPFRRHAHVDRAPVVHKPLPAPPNYCRADAAAQPLAKEDPARSEAYRRLVAALPCAHCGVVGYSQHAHENENKGKGLKLDDRRAMPLCCERPGMEGCHAQFDQYRLLPGGRAAHIAAGKRWAAQTRQKIFSLGQWPKRLPLFPEDSPASV